MKDDYRKDISQGPTGRWGWTRWWSKVERSKVVPGGEKTILMIDLLIQGLWCGSGRQWKRWYPQVQIRS